MIGKGPPKHLKLNRALQVAEGHQLTAGARKLASWRPANSDRESTTDGDPVVRLGVSHVHPRLIQPLDKAVDLVAGFPPCTETPASHGSVLEETTLDWTNHSGLRLTIRTSGRRSWSSIVLPVSVPRLTEVVRSQTCCPPVHCPDTISGPGVTGISGDRCGHGF